MVTLVSNDIPGTSIYVHLIVLAWMKIGVLNNE